MQRKSFRLAIAIVFYILFFCWGCTKIDTTGLGADLIPAVDNVHTFDTTLTVNTTQGLFADTTKMVIAENHVLGSINNDPVFGKTKADLLLELKPSFFPFYFGNPKDTINNTLAPGTGFDSAVLCLSFKGFYGDTSIPQHFTVYQLDDNTSNFKSDSLKLDFQPDITPTNMLGQATVTATGLSNYLFYPNKKDSVHNQIRIKLSSAFLNRLTTNWDSTAAGINNAFYRDSAFKTKYKGFAVVADQGYGGNGLFYISLTDPATRLEIHYRKKNNNQIDTAFTSLPLCTGINTTVSKSAAANHVTRDMSGSEYQVSPQADALYIQSTPGSYANLSIPALSTFQNSIIHRAEIFVEQVPGNPVLDKVLISPAFLYLDIIDTGSTTRFKPLYYDLSPLSGYNPDNSTAFFPSGGIDFNYYGGYRRSKTDAFGNAIDFYTFNLSRYVQNLVTRHSVNYNLRVYSPFNLNYHNVSISYNNSLAFGRVKVGSGNNPNYRLRMRIIYSKI